MRRLALIVFASTGCSGPYEVEDEHVYVDLAVSKAGVCAVDDERSLHCWGYTAANAPEGIFVTDVDMSGSEGCVLGGEGDLTCWGASPRGEVRDDLAARVVATSVGIMAVGYDAVCWDGSTTDPTCTALDGETDVAPPAAGAGTESEVVALAVAYEYACVLHAGGAGGCERAPDAPEIPTEVSALFDVDDLVFIDAGGTSTCVLDSAGQLACAGARDDCDIDDGMAMGPCIDDWSPSGSWRDVATADSSCAVAADGTLVCHGDLYMCPAPEGTDYVRVALEPPDVCGLHADGRISCTVNIAGIDVGPGSEHMTEDALDCQAGHPQALESARCDNVDAHFETGPC